MNQVLMLLAQDEGPEAVAGAMAGVIILVVVLVELAVIAAALAGMCKVFDKAGRPWWGALVPIYNLLLLLEIVGKPAWWIVLYLIPCTMPVAIILVCIDLANSFGKSTGFAIGLMLLPFIFYPVLGFGDAQYVGPQATA